MTTIQLQQRKLQIEKDLSKNPADPRYTFFTPEKSKSTVWKNFRIVKFDNAIEHFAQCRKCRDILSYSTKSGTGSLLRHTCSRRKSKQAKLAAKKKSERARLKELTHQMQCVKNVLSITEDESFEQNLPYSNSFEATCLEDETMTMDPTPSESLFNKQSISSDTTTDHITQSLHNKPLKHSLSGEETSIINIMQFSSQSSPSSNLTSQTKYALEDHQHRTEDLTPPPTKRKRRRHVSDSNTASESESPVNKVIDYIARKRSRKEYNATELMFLSYAKTLEKFSIERQLHIKRQFVEIILHNEAQHQMQQNELSQNRENRSNLHNGDTAQDTFIYT